MGSELIINATLPETRIALLEGGEIQELLIEREASKGIVGNFYKGKVLRVLPGMQAAFVDIGQEKAAFLYVDDIFYPDMDKPLEMPGGGGRPVADTDEDGDEERTERSAARPSPKVSATAPATEDEVAAVQAAIAEGAVPAVEPAAAESDDEEVIAKRPKHREGVSISEIIKEGQEILVQVVKDPIGTKGARLTCHVSLPGRYLVFMPTVDHIGVSRRIESDSDRRRLRDAISKNRPPGTGFIVRTASSNEDNDKIRDDIEYLVRNWNEVQEKYRKSRGPTLIYQDYTMVIRAIRDMVSDEVDRLVVDSRSEFKLIQKFVARFMPSMKSKIELYEKPTPIFDYFGIEIELQRALDRKVWLKSGGYLVVDQAEALTAIDVNTGRFVGKKNLEDTILKTNMEAVKEIAYQLRLRNCGGIIVLDLIDMEKEANREKVYQCLEEALKKDRARPTILKISQLGLVEMTRKRTRDSTVRTLCEPCPYCEGRGYIKNKLTMAYEILRGIERECAIKETQIITLECNPSIAEVMGGDLGGVIDEMQDRSGKRIMVKSNVAFHLEQYEIGATRGEKAFLVKEIRKDARGLGPVQSLADEIEERGTISSRLRRKEWEDSVAGGEPTEVEIEEVMSTLPFTDEEKHAADGERETRDERSSERGRGRRTGGRDRERERDRGKGRKDRDRPAEKKASPASPQPRIALPVPVSVVDDELDDDLPEGAEGAEDMESGADEGAGSAPEAVMSGPRNYEEYIKTAPEAGTELTRTEWEAANYARARANGGRSGGGYRNAGGAGGGDKRRRNRRSRRGGRGRQGPNGSGRPQPHA